MILLTGATGLVGRYLLVQLLRQKKTIRAIYRTEEKRNSVKKFILNYLDNTLENDLNNVDWVQADLLDISRLIEVFKGIEEVYHCAGLVSFNTRDAHVLRKVNIEGTANMVNLALEFSVKKFCHLSSVASLGQEVGKKPIHEESPRNNDKTYNYYEISKYGGEMEVWRASQEGLPVVIVNPAIIIGAGNWQTGSGQLFDRVAKGFPFKIPRASGFVAVHDVVKAMLLLMESEIENERFIVVGKTMKVAEVTTQIAGALQVKLPKYALKKWMVYLLWIFQCIGYVFGGKKELTLSSIPLIFETIDFDTTKIGEQLNFKFTPIKTSIQETAEVYRKTHF